jgi:hypothetical protein
MELIRRVRMWGVQLGLNLVICWLVVVAGIDGQSDILLKLDLNL